MSQSLEWYCETVLINLLTSDPDLTTIPKVHHGPDVASALNTFVVKATRGDRRLDGVKGYDISVEVSYASTAMTPAQLDELADSVIDSVYSNPNAAASVGAIPLTFLSIEDEVSTTREDGKKARKRMVTFPMIADDGNITRTAPYAGDDSIYIGNE